MTVFSKQKVFDNLTITNYRIRCETYFSAISKIKDLNERKNNNLYPGIQLPNNHEYLFELKNVLDKLLLEKDIHIDYDLGFGTGLNYLNPIAGEKIGLHIDKPIYELDENFQIKPEFENRFCSVTLVICLKQTHIQNNIEVKIDEHNTMTYHLTEGDVLVLPGLTPHSMSETKGEGCAYLAAFFCDKTIS